MYQSRLHATNGIVSLAVDATSGELLEFVRESTMTTCSKIICAPLYCWMGCS